jgi:REP element-mobilizing transposase RayT
MKYDPQKHHRRSIRLKGYDYSQRGAYFVTLVTHGRQCLFGQIVDGKMQLNEGGEITHQCWMEIPKHYPHVSLDAFVIMPNHVHGIIIITENDVDDNNIANIVGAIHELPHDESPHDELPLHNESSQQQNELMQSRRKMLLSKIIGRFKMNVAMS